MAGVALRLPEPTWAITTAFVLSPPAIRRSHRQKTCLRIVSAVLGAMTGFSITGSLEQSPLSNVAAVGSVVALTTTACGGQFAPYGLRQWSYTTTLVATQGLWNPEASWSIGLARCSEICIGIAVTTTVQFALWPRYARREFLCGVREILSDIAGDFSARAAFQRCRQVLQAQLLALSTASQAPAETASEAFVHAREEIHAMGWSVKDTLAGLLWVARAEKSYRLTEKLPRSRSTLALEELPTDTAL